MKKGLKQFNLVCKAFCYNITIVIFVCRSKFNGGAPPGGEMSTPALGGVHQNQ